MDANISVRDAESSTLGTRTEVKNINGLRFLAKAVGKQWFVWPLWTVLHAERNFKLCFLSGHWHPTDAYTYMYISTFMKQLLV